MLTICNATKERKFKQLHSRKQRSQFFRSKIEWIMCCNLYLQLLTTTLEKEEGRLKMKLKGLWGNDQCCFGIQKMSDINLGMFQGTKNTLFVGYQFTKNRLKTLLLIIGESSMLGLIEQIGLRFCKNLCETKVRTFVSSSDMEKLILVRLMLHAYY